MRGTLSPASLKPLDLRRNTLRHPSSLPWVCQIAGCAALLAATGLPHASAEGGYESFSVAESALTLRAEATARRFISAHGRRAMMIGYAAEGLEGWVFPFRIFHDYRVGFRTGDSTDVVPGSALVRDVRVNPESVTRVYSGQEFTARETLFVPLDSAGFEILYQVESRSPVHIVLSFQPDLDLMWPGGIGGQSYEWNARRHAFVLLESSGKYSALVGSPQAGNHSTPDSYARPWVADRRLSLELDIPREAGAPRSFPLIVSLGARGQYDSGKIYDDLMTRTPALYAAALEHYRKLLSSNVQVETPDPEVNLAYSWALVALDQAYVCNAWLGCGMVAGYGPSRDTRRPQFAWFFGGDALNNTWALEAAGDHDLALDAVRFIQKYQKKGTGEIFHELSQSAGLIDWFNDYPYAYRHTDVSAMYLVAFRNLYRSSGDLDFLRSSWDSLRAAYNYLVSRIDPSDGLVTVPPGGWGGDETIGEQVIKDVYLESVWVAGAEAFAGLANSMGDRELAGVAQARAEKARGSLQTKFWNPERDFFYYGFSGRGELLRQELGQPNWGIWLGVFDSEKSERALDRMARASWETDWGMRSIPSDDRLYIGGSYGHGSVWPLGTGAQALAFYRYHRPLQAYPLWQSLIDQTFSNSLGHVPEVFSGDFYRELDPAVPEQIWSSGMVTTSLVRGLLGLDPYAPSAQLSWAPHLPAAWPGIKLRRLKVGRSVLNLEMTQSATQVKLRVEDSGPPVEFRFSPEVPLGSEGVRATLNGRSLPVTLSAHAQDVHADVKFSADEKTELVIDFRPGVRPWVPRVPLGIGDAPRGLRVLSSTLTGRAYRAEVEGRPGACSPFVLSTPWQVKEVKGGRLTAHDGTRWSFALSPLPDSCVAVDSATLSHQDGPYQTWTFEATFAP